MRSPWSLRVTCMVRVTSCLIFPTYLPSRSGDVLGMCTTRVNWATAYDMASQAVTRSPEAASLVARCYYTGAGTKRNPLKAAKLYKEGNDVYSRWGFADILINGNPRHTGVARDVTKGKVLVAQNITILESMAKAGNPFAALDLSNAWGSGSHGLTVSLAKEWYWNKVACEAGIASALFNGYEQCSALCAEVGIRVMLL